MILCSTDPASVASDAERLKALCSLGVLDTAPESRFNDLTAFACAVFGVAEAQVTLIDSERLYVKASTLGWAQQYIERSQTFCPHTFLHEGVLVVPDTTQDERFCNNPYVVGEPHIRFYAGFPLLVTNGHKLGAFCLVGMQPRSFSLEEQALLRRVARQASEYLEDRMPVDGDQPSGQIPLPMRTSALQAGEQNGLIVLSETFLPLHSNAQGSRWFEQAFSVKDHHHDAVFAALAEAKQRRAPVSKRFTLNHHSFLTEIWPVGERFALFIRELAPAFPEARRSEAREEQQERLKLLKHTGTPLFWTFNPKNPSEADLQDWLQYTGQSFTDFCKNQYRSCVHPEDSDRTAAIVERSVATGTAFDFDYRIRRSDGVYRWLHAQGKPRFHSDGSIRDWVGVHTDVTERHTLQAALQESIERFELATLATTEGVWDLKLATGEMYYSARLCDLLGISNSSNSLQDWIEHIYPDDLKRIEQYWEGAKNAASGRFETEFRCSTADGNWRWIRVRAVGLRDGEGQLVRLTGTASDISTQRLKDPLTGLHNRSSLLDQVLWRIQKAADFPRNFALYFLDLDSFKQINDSLGHASGDAVLVEVARRLEATLSNSTGNLVARLGGDEFVVLVSDVEAEEDAMSYGIMLQQLLSAPLQLPQPIRVSASIGIAFGTPGKYTTAEQMLEEADVAMYNAKFTGHARVDMFTRTMRDAVISRLSMEQDLRRALDEKQFEVRYQPQIDMPSGTTVGLEALLRWKHPERGWVSPSDFIPAAEEARLIVPIGEWVLEQVLAQISEWQRDYQLPEGFIVSVNISAHQIRGSRFSESLLKRCRELKIDPRLLCLEVTEGALIDDLPTIHTELQSLVSAGFELDLDDFGTGFSSLRYLQRFPFGNVKIDRSFVAGMCTDPRSRSLVQTIIGLANSLDMGVIAEGIENPEQAEALQSMGCTRAQGFLYSPGVNAAEVQARWLPRPKKNSWMMPSPQTAPSPLAACA